jgi:hypothetical protein
MLAFLPRAWQCRGVRSPTSPEVRELSAEERAVIDFERTWWTAQSHRTKQESVRTELGLSPTRYYAVLESLVDSPAALAYDPLLIRRMRRRRAERRRALFFPSGSGDRGGQRRR